MSDGDTIRARLLPDGTIGQVVPDGSTRPLKSRTDWARLRATSEEEIEANARADPDNPPMTPAELDRMRPVPNPKQIRQRLRLTQEQFAARFHVPLGTLRDWEQARTEPDTAAPAYLRVIEKEPEAVARALEEPAAA